MKTPKWVIEIAVNDCKDYKEFAKKYRKAERFTLRGADYISGFLNGMAEDIDKKGFTVICQQASITGEMVAYIEGRGKSNEPCR